MNNKNIDNNKAEPLTRENFIDSTGVFVTHLHFDTIQQQYEKSGLSPKAFCQKWLEKTSAQQEVIVCNGWFTIDTCDDIISCSGEIEDIDDVMIVDMLESISKYCYKLKKENEKLSNALSNFSDKLKNMNIDAKELSVLVKSITEPTNQKTILS